MNPEVVFIYDSSGNSPCHAVRKNMDGQWSRERVAFCGWQAPVGPCGTLTTPQGGLCFRCKEHVIEVDGGYRSATAHADPLAEKLAEKLYNVWAGLSVTWEKLEQGERATWRAVARTAIDNYPVAAPYERYRGGHYDDD